MRACAPAPHLLHPVQATYVVQSVQRGGQTTMQAEDLGGGAQQADGGSGARGWNIRSITPACKPAAQVASPPIHTTAPSHDTEGPPAEHAHQNPRGNPSPPPYLVLYESGEGQVVKEVCEVLPHICIAVLAQALVIEAVPAAQHSTAEHSTAQHSTAAARCVSATVTDLPRHRHYAA
jgi:hypothetical protein